MKTFTTKYCIVTAPQTAGDRNIMFCFLPVCRLDNESVNSEREWEFGMTQAKYLQFFHQKSLSFLSPIVIMISVMILASSSAVWCDLCDFLRVIVSFYRVILTMLSQNFVFLIFTSYLGKQRKYIDNFHSWLHWMSTKYDNKFQHISHLQSSESEPQHSRWASKFWWWGGGGQTDLHIWRHSLYRP